MDFSELNREQRIAVETLEGPLLILAGAGSGKTRTLTYRIANLLEHGVRPWQILAITFTNKAAKEMQSRVVQLSSEKGQEVWVSTFHSMCARILRRDIDKLGYSSSFTIYDDEDQLNVIKSLFKQLSINEKTVLPKEVRALIGEAKNALQAPREWLDCSAKDRKAQAVYLVYDAYEKKLKQSNALDFDDLLIKTLELFTSHPPVLESYQQRFRYVHVDEYQDTNYAQYMLIKMITRNSHNLCVVGDDDQSIYGWRGADVQNILSFKQDYPEAVVIKLEQNYRSTGTILDAANQVIAHNTGRMEKVLWTENDNGNPIELYTAVDERQEAEWIGQKLEQLQSEGYSMGDAAVLYRSNAQSRAIEECFVKTRIPYQVFGAMRFYERKEIKDILAYLRCIANPSDDVSLRRIINLPKRSIGDTTVDELMRCAEQNQMPLYSTIVDIPEQIGARAKKSISNFADMLNELVFIHSEMGLSEFVQQVIAKTGLEAMYRADETEEGKARIENIEEFIGAVTEFERNQEGATLESYLENVSLVTDMDRTDFRSKSVSMMTVHSAKGLEFPIVFLSGMEETIFPHIRSMSDPDQLEEERRLCYVAITRAQKRLFISNARTRMLRNQMMYNPPSRFVAEIPKRLISTKPTGNPYRNRASLLQHVPGKLGADQNALGIPGLQKGFTPSAVHGINPGREVPYRIGDRVVHRKFGYGVVSAINNADNDPKIKIDFDNYGEKEFLLSLAPIVKAGE